MLYSGSPMPGLADIIREKQRRLVEVEAEAATLRKELLEAKQALLGPDAAHLDPTPPSPKASGNSTEWAATVLRQAGRPMHVNDIISAIEREFHLSPKSATLVGNLSRLVKRGRIFERVGPNQFALLEWTAQRNAEELFGREEYEREMGVDRS